MRWLSIYYLLVFRLSALAQPAINQQYDFGRPQSALTNIIVTDSCYYAVGLGRNPMFMWDAVFAKIAFNGDLLELKFLHNDTANVNVYGSQNFIQTNDGNFAAVADIGEYFLFIKYAPNGDTIFTVPVKDFFINDNDLANESSSLIQLTTDSSYTVVGSLIDTTETQTYMVLYNISKSGVLNFYETYPIGAAGYTVVRAIDFLQTDNGYIIAGHIIKDNVDVADMKMHVRIIQTDNQGIAQSSWTDWSSDLNVRPYGLTALADGGFLYGGITGWYNTTTNGHDCLAHIVKLNPDFSKDWDLELGDTTSSVLINFREIIPVGEDEYIATGHEYRDSMSMGWLIRFNLAGEVIWDSYFSIVPVTGINEPLHEFFDLKQTPDNGFVMVGYGHNVQATFEGNPGFFAWLVKTDSVGCLVPGCQDFLETGTNDLPPIRLSVYPNPANDILNIYYNDADFTGKSELMIYDMKGSLVKSWKLQSNDMTYVYDVSGLSAGIYVIELMTEGIGQFSEKFVVNH